MNTSAEIAPVALVSLTPARSGAFPRAPRRRACSAPPPEAAILSEERYRWAADLGEVDRERKAKAWAVGATRESWQRLEANGLFSPWRVGAALLFLFLFLFLAPVLRRFPFRLT